MRDLSPTQEVERLEIRHRFPRREESALMCVRPDGAYVRFEDHKRLLQAEVEKREGPEGDLEQANACAKELAEDLQAAESKLSSAVEELEDRIRHAEGLARIQPDTGTGPAWRANYQSGAEYLKSFRTYLQCLLRDKGTEGGADSVTTSKGGDDDVHSDTRRAAQSGLVARPGLEEEPGPETSHDYLSTACLHELHERCRKTCKFCHVGCRCGCHGDKGTEQGGDLGVGAGTCGDRHGVSPERETGVSAFPSADASASVDSGVAIEGDPGLLLRQRLEHRLKVEREAQANYPRGSLGRERASIRAEAMEQFLASLDDDSVDVYLPSTQQRLEQSITGKEDCE